MKKKLLQITIIFLSIFCFLTFKPLIVEAETVDPVISNKTAYDSNGQQMINGKGYFTLNYEAQIRGEYDVLWTLTKCMFYYTEYNGMVVDYKTNESLYSKKINLSTLPSKWTDTSNGLTVDMFESVSIIGGKWALPHEYAEDVKGKIIPNSTGYLEDSVYIDYKIYVYYLVYTNEDGVDRPDFNKHYETDVKISDIPSYLIKADGKNERMGVNNGIISDSALVEFKAIRNIEYYPEATKLVTTDSKGNTVKGWYPFIYFNINDVDYDVVLSVSFSYVYSFFKMKWYGGYSELENTKRSAEDEVFFEESIEYLEEDSNETRPYFPSSWNSFMQLMNLVNWKSVFNSNEYYAGKYGGSYSLLESGSYEKNIAPFGSDKKENKIFKNRILGHFITDDYYHNNDYILRLASVQFLSITYMYNGVIYCSDENVIINSINQAPDLPTTKDVYEDIRKTLIEGLANLASGAANVVGTSFLDALLAFWNGLNPAIRYVIIGIVVLFVISIIFKFTERWWSPGISRKMFGDDYIARKESAEIASSQRYNRARRRQGREKRRDRRYERKSNKFYRKNMMNDRDYMSNRYDKQYEHERYIQDSKERSFDKKYAHEKEMQSRREKMFDKERTKKKEVKQYNNNSKNKKLKYASKNSVSSLTEQERKEIKEILDSVVDSMSKM